MDLIAMLKVHRSAEAVGLAVALALVLVARVLLPRGERGRTRIAAVYLAIALFVAGIELVLNPAGEVDRFLDFFFYFFVLASCGRSLVLIGVDVVFGRRSDRAPPRIFRDLTQAVVYVIVVMLTLRAVGVEPGSLLTTSALLTAVVGLSLQDTLGNLVSGLALQMQRPFEVGDWIQFESDPRQIGKVTEVNWRATTVMTTDLVEVIVPNALLAKAPIRNYTRPSPISRRSVTVQGPYGVSTKRVHEAILAAVRDAPGVLREPAPWVQTTSFADSGVEYSVFYFTNDFGTREQLDGLVRDRVWYGLSRAGISVPFPVRTVEMHAVTEETERRARERELERRDRVLRCVDFLDVLPADKHHALAASARVRLFAPGEVVVTQGDSSTELFIIDRGEVEVEVARQRDTVPVARLGPGKFFGEMALMTGETRKATVRAVTECELLVVDHAAFHETLSGAPDVVEKLSDLLAARQAELEAVASERRPTIEPLQERSKRLISQIKSFFKL